MHAIQPHTAHLRASRCRLKHARASISFAPARLLARRVTAPQVEPGTFQVAGPRRCSVSAVTRPVSVPKASKPDSAADEGKAQTVVLNTIEYKGQKAYYLAPKDPAAARGVVLFLHGFAQSPRAYALLYKLLIADNLLVVAPDPQPMFSPSTKELQGAIVKSAAFWGDLLVKNEFPPVKLTSDAAARNIGLLGHSVGAGVATYVAKEAAAAKHPRPFKAVMYMAAQTQVYDDYLPDKAAQEWSKLDAKLRNTKLALQFGFADLIAPFYLSFKLDKALENISTPEAPVQQTTYLLGTHVGFEDQLFIGDLDVDEQLLPYANVVLLLLTLLIAAGLPGLALPLWSLLLRRAAREGQDDAKDAAKQILNMPDRSTRTAAADSGVEEGAGPGLSAGEKALLLVQKALDERNFAAKQRPLEASDKPVEGTVTVSILPSEEAWWRYFTMLLLPSGGLFVATAVASAKTEGGWHWLFGALALLSGLFTAGGGVALAVQVYVDLVQRPDARKKAAKYFKDQL